MSVYIAELPNLAGFKKTGADDFLANPEGGPNNTLELINSANRLKPPSVQEILEECGLINLTKESDPETRKAALESLAEELRGSNRLMRVSVREEAVRILGQTGCKSPTALVDAALELVVNEPEADSTQGSTLLFEDIEPVDYHVDGASLFEELLTFYRRYLILPVHAYIALALWTLHTYVWSVSDVTPYLLITSPVMRSGKSRVQEALECLACKPLKLSDSSAAGIFRTIERYAPAILLDEADAFLLEHEEMRGLLNDGWRRGGKVIRIVGDENEPMTFSIYCPKAIAGIGSLTGKWATVADRSIRIPMRRKLKSENVERFRIRKVHEETADLRRKLTRWGLDAEVALKQINPALPDELNDRQQDAWEPLLAIAEYLGGTHPERARTTALALCDIDAGTDPNSIQEQLLEDINNIFDQENIEAIHSSHLCMLLSDLEHRPWPEWKKGKPITPVQLATLLRPFGIKPKQIWIEDKNRNGYERTMFIDAWTRYIGQATTLDSLEPNAINNLATKSECLESSASRGSKLTVNDSKQRVLDGLEGANSKVIPPSHEHEWPIPSMPDNCQKLKGAPCKTCGNPWKWRRGPNLPLKCTNCHPPDVNEVTLII